MEKLNSIRPSISPLGNLTCKSHSLTPSVCGLLTNTLSYRPVILSFQFFLGGGDGHQCPVLHLSPAKQNALLAPYPQNTLICCRRWSGWSACQMFPYGTLLLKRDSLGTCPEAFVETLEPLIYRMYTGNILHITKIWKVWSRIHLHLTDWKSEQSRAEPSSTEWDSGRTVSEPKNRS